jgi:hypothetical protein
MAVVKTRQCPAGHEYDMLVWPSGEALPQSNLDPDDDSTDCPTCGAVEFVTLFGAGHGLHLNKGGPVSYPYWDDTLEAMVESHAHMLKLGAAKGLRPMESRDTLRRKSAAAREVRASADEGKAYLEERETEPWYREMKDKVGRTVQTKMGPTTVFRQAEVDDFLRHRKPRRES